MKRTITNWRDALVLLQAGATIVGSWSMRTADGERIEIWGNILPALIRRKLVEMVEPEAAGRWPTYRLKQHAEATS